VPWGLRPVVSAGAVALLVALLVWFAAELITAGGQAGLAERIFGAGQALWPLAVVVSCQYAASTRTRPSHAPTLNLPSARVRRSAPADHPGARN
jgi:hypothetical protein